MKKERKTDTVRTEPRVACTKCGSPKVERVILEEYKYEGLGIPVMLHRAVIRTTCKACEAYSFTIPKLGELSAAAAIWTVLDQSKLTGQKIKFLRKAMGLRANQLAQRLGWSAETISRIERGHIEISGPLDLTLRLLVIDALKAKAPGVVIDVSLLTKIASNARDQNSQNEAPSFELVRRATKSPRLWDKDIADCLEQISSLG